MALLRDIFAIQRMKEEVGIVSLSLETGNKSQFVLHKII